MTAFGQFYRLFSLQPIGGINFLSSSPSAFTSDIFFQFPILVHFYYSIRIHFESSLDVMITILDEGCKWLQYIVLNWAIWSKSPLPRKDMIYEFMCRKFYFSIQVRVILFACTTTLILLNQTLEFFDLSSTPSPFPLVATSLPFSFASSTMDFTLLPKWGAIY